MNEDDAVRRLNLEAELERVRAELAWVSARAESYLDLAQRPQADFANYKRRVERDRASDAQVTRANTVAELLPLIDDLDRAIAHTPPALADDPWVQGVRMLGGRIERTLSGLGVEKVGTVGEPFDPNQHEAVATAAGGDVAPGHVAEVVRPGYRTAERLMRPAQVVVAAEEQARTPSRRPRVVDERA